ncbi:MAG: class I SAM-dependent methyltransferase, partial [Nitrososphaera sp.]
MREWVDHTVDRIRALQPWKVLEIGCGTGLLLFRIAPDCSRYVGTDFSRSALDYIRSVSSDSQQKLPQVTLLHRLADDFADFERESFDTVILNSVVQYFPDVTYLVRVLEGAVKLVEPGGYIFVGDVRNLALHRLFHVVAEFY